MKICSQTCIYTERKLTNTTILTKHSFDHLNNHPEHTSHKRMSTICRYERLQLDGLAPEHTSHKRMSTICWYERLQLDGLAPDHTSHKRMSTIYWYERLQLDGLAPDQTSMYPHAQSASSKIDETSNYLEDT